MTTYSEHVAGLREFFEDTSAQVVVEALEHLLRRRLKELQKDREAGKCMASDDFLRSFERDLKRLEMVSHILEN